MGLLTLPVNQGYGGQIEISAGGIHGKALVEQGEDYLRAVKALVQATPKAEMTAAIGAERRVRAPGWLSYRGGYDGRAGLWQPPRTNFGGRRRCQASPLKAPSRSTVGTSVPGSQKASCRRKGAVFRQLRQRRPPR